MESQFVIADYFKMPLDDVRQLTLFEVNEMNRYMRKVSNLMKKK